MEGNSGVCPHCEAQGAVGNPCEQALCQKKGYHIIPGEAHAAIREQPLDELDPLVGQMIDDYLVIGVLGEGGFGKVYLSLQMPVFMKTALKLMLRRNVEPNMAQLMIKRFKGEALSLAKLSHPNIVRLLKYGTYGDRPYLVMEYVESARTLEDEWLEHTNSGQGMERQVVQNIMDQIFNALESAHNLRIVHRDLKPENIMLQEITGDPHFVRILDFGLAKLLEGGTKTSMMAGTPVYMAPEQLQGKNSGPWTDVYALGVLIYELFTGTCPFTGDTIEMVISQKLDRGSDPLQKPHVTGLIPSVREFCGRTFCQDIDARYQSISEVRTALTQVFDDLERRGIERLQLKRLLDDEAELPIVEARTHDPTDINLAQVPVGPPVIPTVTRDEQALLAAVPEQSPAPEAPVRRGSSPNLWGGKMFSDPEISPSVDDDPLRGKTLGVEELEAERSGGWGRAAFMHQHWIWGTLLTTVIAISLIAWPGDNQMFASPDGRQALNETVNFDERQPLLKSKRLTKKSRHPKSRKKSRKQSRKTRKTVVSKKSPGTPAPKGPEISLKKFDKTFGGKQDERGYSVLRTKDLGVLVVGVTHSRGAGGGDMLALKLTAHGNLLWQNAFGGTALDVGRSVVELADGKLVIAGFTKSKGNGLEDVWLVKLTATGKRLWDRTYGGRFADRAHAVRSTADGGFLVVGHTRSKGAGQSDGWLIKVDADGKKLWDKTYGTTGNQKLFGLAGLADGSSLLVGSTESPATGLQDLWVVKVDSRGQILWEKRFGNENSREVGRSIVVADNGDLLIGGSVQKQGADEHPNVLVMRISATGKMLWSRIFGSAGKGVAYGIHKLPAERYVVSGETAVKAKKLANGRLFAIDKNGRVLWKKKLKFWGGLVVRSLVYDRDGGLLLTGYRFKPNRPADVWVRKLEPRKR